ncbi:MAG: YggT family protein [Gemmatimonadaceae bacterium]
MNDVIAAIDTSLHLLQVVFFAAAAVLAVVCLVDWLVRTRRINAFGKVARFFRQSVEPLMAPIERRIVKSGGVPSSAPWWALAAAVFGGIVVLTLLGFIRGQLYMAMFAAQEGRRGILRIAITWIFGILQLAIMVRVITSWIRISEYSKWIRWAVVLSEPILRPLRRVIPTLGMIDITPIVAYFALGLLQSFIISLT